MGARWGVANPSFHPQAWCQRQTVLEDQKLKIIFGFLASVSSDYRRLYLKQNKISYWPGLHKALGLISTLSPPFLLLSPSPYTWGIRSGEEGSL